MGTSARELVGWTDQRWTAVEEAVSKALARTAKCRRVIPIGAEQIGAKGVAIPTIEGSPLKYGVDKLISQMWIFVDITLDDQHADDEAAVFRLVESAAAQLGFREDNYVIQSISPVPATTKEPAAPASAPALPQGSGSFLRFPELRPARLNETRTGAKQTAIGAAGAAPTATQIVEAVRKAQAELETVGRPGPSGLLLHSRLFATLLDLAPGGAPYLQHVEHLIDSSEIAGTSALDGGKDGQKEGKRSNAADKESNAPDKESNAADRVCGILFRLEPAALDLVQTARPTVTVLERSSGQTGGQTSLRVEEDVVVRILDQLAIHHIVY